MAVKHFNLPDPGEGLVEAEIVTWKVKVGDTVKVNDIFVEIETAKSLVELPVPYAGTVTALLVSEGDTVEVGTPIISIDDGLGGDVTAEPVVDRDDRGADLHRVALCHQQRGDRAGIRHGQFDQGLGGLDLDEDVVDLDDVPDPDLPGDDLGLDQALARVREVEVLDCHNWYSRSV